MSYVEVRTTVRGEDEERADVEVFVDGVNVVRGHVGGEPEDNTIGRDYAWIPDAFAALAKALGATVTETEGERGR